MSGVIQEFVNLCSDRGHQPVTPACKPNDTNDEILMMRRIQLIITCTFVVVCLAVTAQKNYRLDFTIKDLPGEKLWLIFYYGDQQIRQDTAFTDKQGTVSLQFDDADEIGMYRLENKDKKGMDFLFNREKVDITLDNNFSLDGIEVKSSRENAIFYDYYRHKFDMEDRLEVLRSFLRYYPTSDTFYFTVAEHMEILAGQYQDYLDSIISTCPGCLVTHIIQFDQLPDIRPGTLDEMTRGLYQANYFSSVDLKDTLILNTPLLPVKIIDYLSLYVQPGATREKQEIFFMQAVDSLMKFTDGSPKVREMVVNYLINGFQAYGFENVLTHLIEGYVLGQSCVNDQQEEKLRLRIEGFKKLAVGTMAPDFEVPDSGGNPVKLSNFRGKPAVIIFWSSDCPHCQAILPELNTLYAQFIDKVSFIGISIDEDEKSWRHALEENGLKYTNIAELKGWNGQIIQDYYVYATPTFLVLDPSGYIKAKPTGVGELKTVLEK